MKYILVAVMIAGSVCSAFAADGCKMDTTAQAVIVVMDKYNIHVDSSLFDRDVAEARARLNAGTSYCGSMSDRLSAFSLCTTLALYDWNYITRDNPKAQRELSAALKDFGSQFPASGESGGFTCELKRNY